MGTLMPVMVNKVAIMAQSTVLSWQTTCIHTPTLIPRSLSHFCQTHLYPLVAVIFQARDNTFFQLTPTLTGHLDILTAHTNYKGCSFIMIVFSQVGQRKERKKDYFNSVIVITHKYHMILILWLPVSIPQGRIVDSSQINLFSYVEQQHLCTKYHIQQVEQFEV